jgi:hypothetical protein
MLLRRAVSQQVGSTVTYLHHDQIGSTLLLTNSARVLVGSYTYDPCGQTVAHGRVSTSLGFTGGYTDALRED